MRVTHNYAARIDYDLWMDCLKVKQLDGGTTSINAPENEGLKWFVTGRCKRSLQSGNSGTLCSL